MKLHLHHFSKIKSQKESQNSRNQSFSSYFCMMIEGSGFRAGSGSRSIPLTSGSGSRSGRPKKMWIRMRFRMQIRMQFRMRIRIRNTGQRCGAADLDPDPHQMSPIPNIALSLCSFLGWSCNYETS
jgi:hypothetical protein